MRPRGEDPGMSYKCPRCNESDESFITLWQMGGGGDPLTLECDACGWEGEVAQTEDLAG